MKKNTLQLALAAGCLAATTTPAHADLLLTLSSPQDLANLRVGDAVTINVSLSGLESPQEIADLAVDITIDTAVFAPPTTPVAGSIVPDPAATFDPNAASDPDLVTAAFFLDAGPTPITANGLFFSFSTTVAAPGSGSIGIFSGSALALTPANDLLPLDEDTPLPFTATIPEPTSWLILSLGSALLLRARPRA